MFVALRIMVKFLARQTETFFLAPQIMRCRLFASIPCESPVELLIRNVQTLAFCAGEAQLAELRRGAVGRGGVICVKMQERLRTIILAFRTPRTTERTRQATTVLTLTLSAAIN